MFIDITYISTKNRLYDELVAEYTKRIRWRLNFISLTQKKHSPSLSTAERRKLDTSLIIGNLSNDKHNIILDKAGSLISTEALHLLLEKSTKPVNFVLGGNDGFEPSEITNFDKISLSLMTFTLNMSLAILVEQIYRCYTLSNNIAYHK